MNGSAGGTTTTERGERSPKTNFAGPAARSSGLRAASLPGLALLASCIAVAGCTSTSQTAKIDPKLGVAPSPLVVGSGEPVPKGGGRYMTGQPYRIAGRWYKPMENPTTDYKVVGIASWYGPGFHGRRTANGEVFDSTSLSAAHPTLPLPSYVRVTNLNNGRSIIVRVNDRGPFHSRRVMDVSRLVAEKLDFKRKGMARVMVQYVGPARMDGLDHNMLLASYRENGEAPAPSAPAPATRELMIASNTAPQPVLRRAAPTPAGTPTATLMLARSSRVADTGPVQRSAPAPARTAPAAAAPAPVAEPTVTPQTLTIAAADPATLPPATLPPATMTDAGVPQSSVLPGAMPQATGEPAPLPGVTAPALVGEGADPAVADPALAATQTIAIAGVETIALPLPRPGSTLAAAPSTVETASYQTAAVEPAQVLGAARPLGAPPADVAAAAPAPQGQGAVQLAAAVLGVPMPVPSPRRPSADVPAGLSNASMPADVPVASQPAVARTKAVAPAVPTPRRAPTSIDDLIAPPASAPAQGFAPMTLTPSASFAAAPRRTNLEAALARFVAGARVDAGL